MLFSAPFGWRRTPHPAETTRFAISRDGDPIGTSTVEIDRSGDDVTVSITTDLTVNVLFFTAYRFKQTTTERWNSGHLVNLNATTDNNGTRHKVAVRSSGNRRQLTVDGKTSPLDDDIVPSTLWNPEFLRHSAMLDVADGKIMPVSVTDNGMDTLGLDGKEVQAHHYTINARYSEAVWYDSQGQLVRVKVIGPDGSVILYQPAELGKRRRPRLDGGLPQATHRCAIGSIRRPNSTGATLPFFGGTRLPHRNSRRALLRSRKLVRPCVRIAPHMSDRGRSHTEAGQALPAPGIGRQFSRSDELW